MGHDIAVPCGRDMSSRGKVRRTAYAGGRLPPWVVGVALGLLAGTGCNGADAPTIRIEGENFWAEFPDNPEFPVLTLSEDAVLGKVRLFGDGRVAVHKYSEPGGWQDYDLRLLPGERDEIMDAMGEAGVFEYDHERVRSRLREVRKGVPNSSHFSRRTLEIRLSRYRGSQRRVVSDFSHRAWITNSGFVLRHADHYEEIPELVGLAEVTRRLLALSKRSDLRLVEADRDEATGLPSWAATPRDSEVPPRILYFTGRPTEVWTMDWLGGDHRRLARLADSVLSHDQPPSVSPDSTSIAFRQVGRGLQLVNLSTGKSRKLIAADDGSHSAVWSPDGDVLAVSAHIGDHRYHAFVVDPDGSNLQRLTDMGAKPLQWSKDGERLYFKGYSEPGPYTYVVDRDGTNTRRVLPMLGRLFQLSPDGRRAAFWAPDEPRGSSEEAENWLRTVKLSGSSGTASGWRPPVRVARGVSGFDWSPDSRYLVFTAGRRLGVVRRDGRKSRILIHVEVGDRVLTQAKWSPDGNAIVFVKKASPSGADFGRGGPEIWVMGRDGADPRRVATGLFPQWLVGSNQPR